MAYRIEQDFDPQLADIRVVRDGLSAFNISATGVGTDQYWPVVFYIRDEQDVIVGGVLGDVWGARFTLETLWIADEFRGRGLGAELVRRAEHYAAEQGATVAHLDTFNFQAGPSFYKRLGYHVFGAVQTWADFWTESFMTHEIADERPQAKQYDARANVETTGYTIAATAERYDRARPQPPGALVDLVDGYRETDELGLVVDLGSGTGLSTFVWAEPAGAVIGIEPSAEMREVAAERLSLTGVANVEFRDGTSSATGVDAASADVVVISQGFHYMEPASTLAEVARILRPGGVFAVVDYDGTPHMGARLETAFEAYRDKLGTHWERLGMHQRQYLWDKGEHLARLRASGHFRFVREATLQQTDNGSAVRVMDLARAIGEDAVIRAAGVSESELGLSELDRIAAEELGDGEHPFRWSYRVRLGVR